MTGFRRQRAAQAAGAPPDHRRAPAAARAAAPSVTPPARRPRPRHTRRGTDGPAATAGRRGGGAAAGPAPGRGHPRDGALGRPAPAPRGWRRARPFPDGRRGASPRRGSATAAAGPAGAPGAPAGRAPRADGRAPPRRDPAGHQRPSRRRRLRGTAGARQAATPATDADHRADPPTGRTPTAHAEPVAGGPSPRRLARGRVGRQYATPGTRRPAGVHQPGRARGDRRAAALRRARGGDDRAGHRGVRLGAQRARRAVPQPVRHQGDGPAGSVSLPTAGVPGRAAGSPSTRSSASTTTTPSPSPTTRSCSPPAATTPARWPTARCPMPSPTT